MTQPQYGQPPQEWQPQPQGPPPAQQQPWPANYQQQPAAPGGWPTSAPAPQQQPAQPVAAPVNTNYQWDSNGIDPSRGGGVSPAARELIGRTVIIAPKRVDQSASYQGQSRPTAYFDLYVIDGGPLQFGSSEDRANPRPATHVVDTPAFFAGAMMGNSEIVKEIQAKLGKGLIVGVIEQGTKGNRPFLIQPCSTTVLGQERPDGAQRKQLAQQVWEAHHNDSWTPPAPTELAVAPAGYGVVNYGQQPQYAPQGPPPAWGQQPFHPQPVPASAQQWLPPSPPAVPAPPGYDVVTWASYTPDQQQQIAAQYAAFLQQQSQAQPQQQQAVVTPTGAPPPGTQPTWS